MDDLEHKDLPEYVSEFFSQEMRENDRNNLYQWLNENKGNAHLLREFNDIWQASALTNKDDLVDENEAWEKFKVKLTHDKPKKRSEWLRYAAVALIFFLVGSLLYYYFSLTTSSGKLTFQEVFVPYGSTSKIILPDGSIVWLNAGSYLKYNNNFNISNRDLFLKGEAFFEVHKNPKLGFIVNTPGLEVRAVGTKFNIKAYPEEKSIITTVVEGKIKVSHILENGKKSKEFILSTKQSAMALKNPVKNNLGKSNSGKLNPVSKDSDVISTRISGISTLNNTDKYVSWHEGRLIIEREKLGELAIDLERKYNVKITFADESVKNYVFSGVLKDETFEQVIEVIRLTSPIIFTIDGNKVKLMEHKSLKNRL